MINKLKNIFLPKDHSYSGKFTNEDLLRELKNCFRINLENESVGERMLFPTSFNVLLNPQDYYNREQALPFVVQEIVNQFYKIIREKISRYPNYIPPSKNWHFQFSPTEEISVGEGELIEIESGSPYIMAKLYTVKFSNVRESTNTRVSFKPKNSDTYSTFNINPEVLNGIDVIASGVFTLKFDDSLNPLREQPNHQESNVFAELSYTSNNKIHHYSMIDKEIIISGENDTRKDSWVLVLPNNQVQNSYAQIKYDPTTNAFLIAAFGPLKVNERTIPVSQGGNIQWFNLTRKAKIMLVGNFFPIPIEFDAKK